LFDILKYGNLKSKLTDNGTHLNEKGYYYLAEALGKSLGFPANKQLVITLSKHKSEASPSVKNTTFNKKRSEIQFTIDQKHLPLPIPEKGLEIKDTIQLLKVAGLKKGIYNLTADGLSVAVASSKKWEEGVEITQGPAFTQAKNLRELITKKNELFFAQYRPLNKTYITGFRSYEQGRHKQGLENLSFIITWLEAQIESTHHPKPITYRLNRVN
jgi:hypothetical protein